MLSTTAQDEGSYSISIDNKLVKKKEDLQNLLDNEGYDDVDDVREQYTDNLAKFDDLRIQGKAESKRAIRISELLRALKAIISLSDEISALELRYQELSEKFKLSDVDIGEDAGNEQEAVDGASLLDSSSSDDDLDLLDVTGLVADKNAVEAVNEVGDNNTAEVFSSRKSKQDDVAATKNVHQVRVSESTGLLDEKEELGNALDLGALDEIASDHESGDEATNLNNVRFSAAIHDPSSKTSIEVSQTSLSEDKLEEKSVVIPDSSRVVTRSLETPDQPKDPLNHFRAVSQLRQALEVGLSKSNKFQDIVNELHSIDDKMPDCAEKTLSVLKILNKTSNRQLIKSKSMLGLLHSVAQQLLQQIQLEFRSDHRLQKLAANLIESEQLPGRKRLNDRLRDISNTIQPLNLADLLAYTDKAVAAADKIRDKSIILFIGSTGAGKSTTIHFLGGSSLEKTTVRGKPHIQPSNCPPGLESFSTSCSTQSETRVINAVDVPLSRLKSGNLKTITLCDSPGFGDTAGAEVDIANGIGLVRALKGCRRVTPVLLISAKQVGDRFDGPLKLIDIVSSMLPDFHRHISSFTYIFTKYDESQREEIRATIEDLQDRMHRKYEDEDDEDLIDVQKPTKNQMAFINDLKNKIDFARILDPVNDNRLELALELARMPGIQNPSREFQDFASQASLSALKDQLHRYRGSIDYCLKHFNIPLLTVRMEQFAKVKAYFNLSEAHRFYDSALEKIAQVIEDLLVTVDKRMAVCLDPKNAEVGVDLNSCSQAMFYLYQLEPIRSVHLKSSTANLRELVSQKITAAQRTLSDNITAIITQPHSVDNLTKAPCVVQFDKMKAIIDVFSKRFSNFEVGDDITSLANLYDSVKSSLNKQVAIQLELGKTALKTWNIGSWVETMDFIQQMIARYGVHLQVEDLKESYSTLQKDLEKLWGEGVENAKSDLVLNKISVQQLTDIRQLHTCLTRSTNYIGIFKHFDESCYRELVKALDDSINHSLQVTLTLLDNEKTDYALIFTRLQSIDALRESDAITLLTETSYQKITQVLRDRCMHSFYRLKNMLKMLDETKLGSHLSIDFKKHLDDCATLKSLSIFEGHPAGIYNRELETCLDGIKKFKEKIDKARHDIFSEKSIDAFCRRLFLLEQLHGLENLLVLLNRADLLSLIVQEEVNWFIQDLDQIGIPEKMIRDSIDLTSILSKICFLAAMRGLPEGLTDCVDSQQKSVLKSLKFQIISHADKVDCLYHECIQNISSEKIRSQLQDCVFGIAAFGKLARVETLVTQNIARQDVNLESMQWLNELFEQFRLRSAHWFDAEHGLLVQFYQATQGLLDAKTIDIGDMSRRTEFVTMLQSVDEFMPMEQTFAKLAIKLENKLRSQEMNVVTELSVLASTNNYQDFIKKYTAALIQNPAFRSDQSLTLIIDSIKVKMQKIEQSNAKQLETFSPESNGIENLINIFMDSELFFQGVTLLEDVGVACSSLKESCEVQSRQIDKKFELYVKKLTIDVNNHKYLAVELVRAKLSDLESSARLSNTRKAKVKEANQLICKCLTEHSEMLKNLFQSAAPSTYPEHAPVSFLDAMEAVLAEVKLDAFVDYKGLRENVIDSIKTNLNKVFDKAILKDASDQYVKTAIDLENSLFFLPKDLKGEYTKKLVSIKSKQEEIDKTFRNLIEISAQGDSLSPLLKAFLSASSEKNQSQMKNILQVIEQKLKQSIVSINQSINTMKLAEEFSRIEALFSELKEFSEKIKANGDDQISRDVESDKTFLDISEKSLAVHVEVIVKYFSGICEDIQSNKMGEYNYNTLTKVIRDLLYLLKSDVLFSVITSYDIQSVQMFSGMVSTLVEKLVVQQESVLHAMSESDFSAVLDYIEGLSVKENLFLDLIGCLKMERLDIQAIILESAHSLLTANGFGAKLSEMIGNVENKVKVTLLNNPDFEHRDESIINNQCLVLSKQLKILRQIRILGASVPGATIDFSVVGEQAEVHLLGEIQKIQDELQSIIHHFPSRDDYASYYLWHSNLRIISEQFDDDKIAQESKLLLTKIDRIGRERLRELAQELSNEKNPELLKTKIIEIKTIGLMIPSMVKMVNQTVDLAFHQLTSQDGGAQRLVRLGALLREETGDEQATASAIISEHAVFKTQQVSIRNEKTLRYSTEQVLADLRGDAINSKKLSTAVDRWKKIYWDIVEDNIHNHNVEALKLNLQVKQIANSRDDQNDKVIKICANLFAYWTLKYAESNTNFFDLIEENEGINIVDSSKKYLLQPHAAQIISIFRLLGVDGVGVSKLDNHLVQIGTGEGKSVTLAITAIILSLLGNEVDCVCYSEYLSNRDFSDFSEFFSYFGVRDFIQYGTFNEICERHINQGGDIRTLLRDTITGRRGTTNHSQHSRTKKVLLVDEVDVFFSSDFYGNHYQPLTELDSINIRNLIKHVWSKKAQIKALTLDQIKKSPAYAACIKEYDGSAFLIDSAVEEMCADLRTFDDHEYEVINGCIGYKEQDGIVFNSTRGYKTVFAHLKEFSSGNIGKMACEERLTIIVDAGIFSYAEIPSQYQAIMGVTGTLETLSEPEKEILEKFNIKKSTYMPSVYGANQLEFAGDSIRDYIIASENVHTTEIGKEIQRRRDVGKGAINRPIIIFFSDYQKLKIFYDSPALSQLGIKSDVNVLSAYTRNDDKDGLISQAILPNKVTLVTRDFGRGTDFKCNDDRIDALGGVHVIQTFFTDSLSEETQIKGRTARQGNRGSYSLVVSSNSLERFGISESMIGEMKAESKLYTKTNDQRKLYFNNKFKTSLKALSEIREAHNESQNFIKKALLPNKIDAIKKFLEARCQRRVYTTSVTGSAKKTVCLLDATCSMCHLLDKTKSRINDVFDRVFQVLKEANKSTAFDVKFVIFRNYNSKAEKLLEYSDWASSPEPLKDFLRKIGPDGGWGNEAIEVGMAYINEIAEKKGNDIGQVILIGDAAPNEKEEVAYKRSQDQSAFGESYWQQYPRFSKQTYYKDELNTLARKGIALHTFYVENPGVHNSEEVAKKFEELSQATKDASTGKLDIHSSSGGEDLTNIISSRILNQIDHKLVERYEARYGHLGKYRPSATREQVSQTAFQGNNMFSGSIDEKEISSDVNELNATLTKQ